MKRLLCFLIIVLCAATAYGTPIDYGGVTITNVTENSTSPDIHVQNFVGTNGFIDYFNVFGTGIGVATITVDFVLDLPSLNVMLSDLNNFEGTEDMKLTDLTSNMTLLQFTNTTGSAWGFATLYGGENYELSVVSNIAENSLNTFCESGVARSLPEPKSAGMVLAGLLLLGAFSFKKKSLTRRVV